jgi:acyl-CoA thioesterase-2
MRAGITARSAIGYGSLAALDDEAEQAARAASPGNFGSLDHAIWFHRVPSVTGWLYCEARPMTVRDSRGLVMGTIFDRAGRHLATFTQEVFLKADRAQEPEPAG